MDGQSLERAVVRLFAFFALAARRGTPASAFALELVPRSVGGTARGSGHTHDVVGGAVGFVFEGIVNYTNR